LFNQKHLQVGDISNVSKIKMNVITKEVQTQLTPDQALQMLKDGNDRFVSGNKADRSLLQQVEQTANGQNPIAVVLSCMDSRTSAEHIMDLGFGDVFSIRVAGNVVNDDVLGSMEYGTAAVGCKLIVVMGHTKCGAVVGACNDVALGNLTQLLDKIKAAAFSERLTVADRNGNNPTFVSNVTRLNVTHGIEAITAQSPVIKDLVESGSVKIVGAIYDITTGKIDWL
jgi:carbonic anhydrase